MPREMNHRLALEKTARIFSQDFDIQVIIGGDHSYTNGRRIVLHDQPSVLSQHPAEVQKDLLWHELGHVEYTDFDVPKGGVRANEFMMHLHNMTEDGFVERRLSTRYVGIDFVKLHQWGFEYHIKKGALKDPKSQVMLAIYSVLCDQRAVAMQFLDPDLVVWAAETFEDQVDQLDPVNCKGTAHTLEVAKEIREILRKLGHEEAQDQLQLGRSIPQEEDQDDKESQGSGEKETSQEGGKTEVEETGDSTEEETGQEAQVSSENQEEGQGDPKSQEAEDQKEETGSGQKAQEGEEGNSKEESTQVKESDNEATSDVDESGDAGSSDDTETDGDGGETEGGQEGLSPQDSPEEEVGSDEEQEAGDQSSEDESSLPEALGEPDDGEGSLFDDGGEGSDDSEEAPSKSDVPLKPKVDENLREALGDLVADDVKLNLETEVTRIVDELMDQGGQAQKVGSDETLSKSTPVDVAHMINSIRRLDTYTPADLGKPASYISRWNSIRPDVTKVIQLVQRMTLAQTKSRMTGCTDVGRRINTKYLTRLKTDSRPALYQERVKGKSTDSAWLILVDQTVSMRGAENRNAINMLIAWGEMLNALKQPFAAWGFGHVGSHDADIGDKILLGQQYTRAYPLKFSVFKDFNQSWALRKSAALKVMSSAYQTPTHWAMLEALLALVDRPEPRKVLTVVTDGDPNDKSREPWGWDFAQSCCESVIKLAERMGIDVVVVGVANMEVDWKIPDERKLHVPDVSQLASKMTEFTAKFWKGRILQDTGVWQGLKV